MLLTLVKCFDLPVHRVLSALLSATSGLQSPLDKDEDEDRFALSSPEQSLGNRVDKFFTTMAYENMVNELHWKDWELGCQLRKVT
ncbi:hypothetical protein V6N13_011633 [Hibiscus sabdariffa]|uniref:Uncharacterized protein n=1 Tax=Hibiscus sabdariffa TaxID=183260 RepID=A0ABR2SCU1_9ROSI